MRASASRSCGPSSSVPSKAAAYGADSSRDLIEELCNQVRHLPDGPLRTLVLGALASYKDPRVREILRKEIHASQNPEALTLAACYLSGEDEDDGRQGLSSLLMQNHSSMHARAAARAMAGYPRLSQRESIRIAVFGIGTLHPPELSAETESIWFKELRGHMGAQARRLMEKQGEAAFIYLKGR